MMRTIHVPLGARAYDVCVGSGAIKYLPEAIKKVLPSSQKKFVIITEKNVAALHLEALEALLQTSGYECVSLILDAGEGTKNFANLEKVVRFCLQHHVERSHAIIALGGGVIGDLTGFAASMVRRGCKFIQIPTTLLAQVDSSVGGKTAINAPEGKNLIGAFYQPCLVIADTDYLKTLPKRDYYAGYAEVLKYGLLGDKPFFERLAAQQDKCDAYDEAFLTEIVSHSVQMKADIVVEDETEKGRRALLNLGHTFGHAYEAETGYSDRLLHGEAIALGMVHAFAFSASCGYCTSEEADLIKSVLAHAHLPVDVRKILPNIDIDKILAHISQDKKVSSGQLTFILVNGIGDAFVKKNVPADWVRSFLLTL